MHQKVMVVLNPVAGGGRAGAVAKQLEDELKSTAAHSQGNLTVELFHTTRAGEGIEFGRRSVKENFTHVVAVGGDGTLSEVVHGVFIEAGAPQMPPNLDTSSTSATLFTAPIRLLHLTAGTGADFARLGYSCRTVNEVLCALAHPVPVNVDVGCLSYPSSNECRYFINEASLGISSAVVQTAERYKPRCRYLPFGRSLVFFLASAVELLRMARKSIALKPVTAASAEAATGSSSGTTSPSPVTTPTADAPLLVAKEVLEAPKEDSGWFRTEATSIAFCNGKYFGGGMQVAPDATATDQRLSVTIWRETFCGFLAGMLSVYNGRHTQWETTTTLEGSAWHVRAGDTLAESGLFECDGELVPIPLPATVFVAGKALFCAYPPNMSVVKEKVAAAPINISASRIAKLQ